ncbi:MAG: penicillin-binding protein 2, partial [Deltaproteobacteria bacterium]|nr:penicillin-binding protein 2 [Deltaproteobacteria bacterium]
MRKKKGGYSPKYRLYLVLVIFSVLFLAILARAFELQVLKSENLKKMAMRQHRKTVSVQSRRGDIYDRNLKELAVSIEVDSVFVQPSKIESPRQAVKVLSAALSIDRSEIERKISSSPNFVWLKRQVDLKEEQRKALSAVSGVGIMKESRRFYPNKQLASNLVGFTGLDSNGLEGVELFYDSTLKGENRKFTGEKDAMGRLILFENIEQAAPSQGMVVELTIDKNIQYITEKALKKAVEASGAKGGTALVMDPLTGEILAMASLPTFDPNNFGKFEPRHWRNRVVTDLFEPGSTFKLFLVSAALEEGIIRPGDSFFCENGSYKVADRVFHDHEKYGWLTVSQIIKYSSNIGSAKV